MNRRSPQNGNSTDILGIHLTGYHPKKYDIRPKKLWERGKKELWMKEVHKWKYKRQTWVKLKKTGKNKKGVKKELGKKDGDKMEIQKTNWR